MVVGILIALYINNWSEENKQRNNRNATIEQLKEENLLHLTDLTGDISYRDTLDVMLQDFHVFLGEENLEENQKQLKNYLGGTLRSSVYYFSNNYLQKYIRENPKDDSRLTVELLKLDMFQKALEELSNKAFEYKFDHILTQIEPIVDFSTLEIKELTPLKSLKFRNNILILENLETELFGTFEETIAQQQLVDSLITAQLR